MRVAYAPRMRFVVYGAGAVGGVTAALLVRAGHEVIAIARGAHGHAIAERGLIVETPDGTLTIPLRVVDHPAKIEWRAGHVVLLAVKTQDVAACVRELAVVDPPTVCLTNGLEAERIAARHLSHVMGAFVWVPATHLQPGVVQVWSWPRAAAIDLGGYPHGSSSVVLATEHLASESRDDIMRWKRGKLLGNLGNAFEALVGPKRSWVIDAARAEGVACFEAAGYTYATDTEIDARRRGIELRPIHGRLREGGSTWQSLARGGSLEVDFLNGEIALLGRQHGVPTPINAGLQRLANAAARAGARPGQMALAELEAALLA